MGFQQKKNPGENAVKCVHDNQPSIFFFFTFKCIRLPFEANES